MAETVYPVEIVHSAIVRDPVTAEVLTRVDVPNRVAALIQALNIELTRLDYAPLFFHAETRTWATTRAGARRI